MVEKDSIDDRSISVLRALLQRPGVVWRLVDSHGCMQEPPIASTPGPLLSMLCGRPDRVLVGMEPAGSMEVRWAESGLQIKHSTLAGPLGGSGLRLERHDARVDRTILARLLAAGAVQGELDEDGRRELGAIAFLSRVLDLLEGCESPFILECAAGSAPLSLALQASLICLGRQADLILLDQAEGANEDCRRLAGRLGLAAEFLTMPILAYQPAAVPDILLAVHACGQATLEALAFGLGLGVPRLVFVPCCAPQGSWPDAGQSYGEAKDDPHLRSHLDSIGQILRMRRELRQAGYETNTFEAYLRPWRTKEVGLAAYLPPP